MKYAIVTNPASGNMNLKRRRKKLEDAARILGAPIFGFETGTKEEFIELVKEVSSDYDVLVVGGGDGTFSDVINSIDLSSSILAFLPLGSGNALKNALGLRGTVIDITQEIRNADVHSYDLIECSARKFGFMVSIGIEGVVVRLREKYLEAGVKGLQSYLIPTLDAYIRDYKRVSARMLLIEENSPWTI